MNGSPTRTHPGRKGPFGVAIVRQGLNVRGASDRVAAALQRASCTGLRLRLPGLSSPALRVWALALLGGLPAALAAQSLRDDRGVEHRFERPPQRIVSLLPSLTESVCALGACARLVGTDRYSNHPDSVKALPKLGGLDDAVVERIVSLRPDVVLSARSTRANARLESLGLKVMAFDSDRHEQVQSSLLRLGHVLGLPGEGERLWARIESELAQAAAQVPPALRGARVYFEADSTPYAAGAASFVGQTLARLGLANIATADMGPFPKLNPEHIVRVQPGVIMASQRQALHMAGRPGWGQLEALAQQRVCRFDEASYEMLIRPGPRLGVAARAMSACLAQLPRPAPAPPAAPASARVSAPSR